MYCDKSKWPGGNLHRHGGGAGGGGQVCHLGHISVPWQLPNLGDVGLSENVGYIPNEIAIY